MTRYLFLAVALVPVAAYAAERLGIDAQTVSWMARQAGLPMRKRRRAKSGTA